MLQATARDCTLGGVQQSGIGKTLREATLWPIRMFLSDLRRIFCKRPPILALQNMLARLDPALDEQPYFQLDWGSNPPEARHASWDYCDMAGRYVDALILIRQMTGNRTGLDVEVRLRTFLLARANTQDGLFTMPKRPGRTTVPTCSVRAAPCLAWSAGFCSQAIPKYRPGLTRLIAGLSRIALHHDDYCVYPKDRWIDGVWVEGGLWNGKAPGYAIQQVIGIARYYEATGNPVALDLAGKLARYFVYHSGVVINFDGTFQGHTHSGGILPKHTWRAALCAPGPRRGADRLEPARL